MDSTFYDNKKLIEARELMGKNKAEIADDLGVNKMLITRAEAGKDVSFRAIATLCNYYRIPVTSIIYPHPAIATA